VINKLIKDTLSPLGVHVSFQTYSGNEKTYITFFSYNEQGQEWAENKEIATCFYVQVDIWSKSDYVKLEEKVKQAMEKAQFKRISAQELYESDTKTFHKALRFAYVS
jgi:hypothetical protein